MLLSSDLTDDVRADWLWALWTKAPTPTPAEAMRLTETKIAKVSSAHRIQRITVHDALAILRRPALTGALGTADAACAHIAAVAERLSLVNRQSKTAADRRPATSPQPSTTGCESGRQLIDAQFMVARSGALNDTK